MLVLCVLFRLVFFFKQKTAYEMRISDWSSDVCSSDLMRIVDPATGRDLPAGEVGLVLIRGHTTTGYLNNPQETAKALRSDGFFDTGDLGQLDADGRFIFHSRLKEVIKSGGIRSEEHTSELQSLMRISYAVFCLKKKKS